MERLKQFSLLYVDDEPQALKLIKDIFANKVRVLYTADNGEKGFEIFKKEHPDIVITDIHMPKMNGLELSEKIKKTRPETPIIMLTALDEKSFLHRSIELGIDAYITKPVINLDLLRKPLEKIASQLSKSNDKKRVFEQIEKMMNLQKSIVFVSNGIKTNFANQAFLDFFGVTHLNQFVKKHTCVCHLFLANETCFHLGKIEDKESWLEVLEALDDENRRVAIQGASDNTHIFQVVINVFDAANKIIVLSDITATIKEVDRYKTLSQHDALTGIFNRGYLDAMFDRYHDSAKRENKNLAMIMFDLDYFKNVNDTYGHVAGDKVLIEVTQLVKSSIRIHDTLTRWGGEEFIILVEVSSLKEAVFIAESLRANIEKSSFYAVGTLTCSFGVSLCNGRNHTLNQCIKNSDVQLYKAKADGRNRVCF